ncbi:MAG: hypothetical protein L0221_19085 [Chloroflexi bacterium]|nr:hypothetical protein [Chloroflexota bacterium]
MAVADGQAVVITELEGDGRIVQLAETELPEQGVVVGGELRSVVTHYPGSSKPSTQIMGTKEDDIELRGWLRDRWTGLDGGAMEQVRALRNLRIGQRYCELAWGEGLVVRGYVRRVEHEIVSEHAIRYRVVFQVDEADESEVLAVPFEPAETAFDLVALLREIAGTVEDVAVAAVLVNNVAHAVT